MAANMTQTIILGLIILTLISPAILARDRFQAELEGLRSYRPNKDLPRNQAREHLLQKHQLDGKRSNFFNGKSKLNNRNGA